MRFAPHTEDDIDQMLATLGLSSVDELFADIPAAVRLERSLDLPAGMAEQDVYAHLLDLARRHSATLVTTQKDMARLAGAHGPCAELKAATRALPVRLTLADADAERLMSLVATALQTPRG